MALTVRERSSASSGTLSRPNELALDLSRVEPSAIVRRFVLGYEGQAATAVYGFTAPRRIQLQAIRRSDDPAIVHVAVALLEAGSRQRVADLVSSPNGIGPVLILPKGRYLVVASLLLAETVAVELELQAAPVKTRLIGVAAGRLRAEAIPVLSPSEPPAIATGAGPSMAVARRPLLVGSAGGELLARLSATALVDLARLINGVAAAATAAIASAAPFHWIDARGRAMGPLITIKPANWNRTPVRTVEDALLLRLRSAAGAPLSLAGLELALELWDSRRLIRYAAYTPVVLDAAGGLVRLDLAAAAVHTLPDESCWDLRVFSPATGQTVYLLQGSLQPLAGYTTLPNSAALLEDGDWLNTEGGHYLVLEGA